MKVARKVQISTLEETIALLEKRDRRFYRDFRRSKEKKKGQTKGRDKEKRETKAIG